LNGLFKVGYSLKIGGYAISIKFSRQFSASKEPRSRRIGKRRFSRLLKKKKGLLAAVAARFVFHWPASSIFNYRRTPPARPPKGS
jgi:hypothetical protein